MGNQPTTKISPDRVIQIEPKCSFDVTLSKLEKTLNQQSEQEPDSVDFANTLDKIGEIYRRKGKLDEALAYFKSSLHVKKRKVPFSLTYAITLANIGCVFKERGEYEQALYFLESSLSIKKQNVSEDSMDIARSYSNLAIVLNHLGRKTEAKELYNQSLLIKQRLEPDSASTAISYVNVAAVCQPKEAMRNLSKAYSIAVKCQPANDSLMVYILTNMASVQFKLGELDKSLTTIKKALLLEKKFVGCESLTAAGIYDIMARILEKNGHLEAASDARSKATNIRYTMRTMAMRKH